MTESQYAMDTVEQIYMSFGDNQTDEAIQVLNKYAESYSNQKCDECNNKPLKEVGALQRPTDCPLDIVDQGTEIDTFNRR